MKSKSSRKNATYSVSPVGILPTEIQPAGNDRADQQNDAPEEADGVADGVYPQVGDEEGVLLRGDGVGHAADEVDRAAVGQSVADEAGGEGGEGRHQQ